VSVPLALGGILAAEDGGWSKLFYVYNERPSQVEKTPALIINLSCHLPKEIEAASQYKQSDLDFKTSGGDGMNGFWQ
jgi:hypothetical protein